MRRSKDLPFNRGIKGDDTYFWYSSMMPNGTMDKVWTTDKMVSEFYLGMSKTTKIMPANHYIGKGTIDSTNGKNRFNRCSHSSFTGLQVPYAYWIHHPKSTNPKDYGYSAVFNKAGMSGSPVGTFAHLEESTRNAASRAWWEMQPRFEGQISMINFLYELKDVRELLGHAYKIFNKLKGLRKFANIHMPKKQSNVKRRKTEYDVSKPIAALYLENEFGIKPLIKDAISIWGQLGQQVQDAQSKFKALGAMDRGLTHHYSETLGEANQTSFGTGNSYFKEYGIKTKTVFTATLKYKYDYDLRDQRDAFMKYWGLNGSYEALWEATPFSFILDYFVKIGDAIHAMEVDPNVKVFTMDYCESIKTTKSSGTFFAKDSRVHGYVIDGKPVSTGQVSGYTGTLYDRMPTVPNKGLYVPRLSDGLSNKQATNLAAVLRSII